MTEEQQDPSSETDGSITGTEEPPAPSCAMELYPDDLRGYLLAAKAGIDGRADIREHLEGSCDSCRETIRFLRMTEPLLQTTPLKTDPYVRRLVHEISEAVFGSASPPAPVRPNGTDWTPEATQDEFNSTVGVPAGARRALKARALRARLEDQLSSLDYEEKIRLDRWTQDLYTRSGEQPGRRLSLAEIVRAREGGPGASMESIMVSRFLVHLLATPGLLEAADDSLFELKDSDVMWNCTAALRSQIHAEL